MNQAPWKDVLVWVSDMSKEGNDGKCFIKMPVGHEKPLKNVEVYILSSDLKNRLALL